MFTLPIPFMTSFAIRMGVQVLVTFIFFLLLLHLSFFSVTRCIGLSFVFFSLQQNAVPHSKWQLSINCVKIFKFAYKIRYKFFKNATINYGKYRLNTSNRILNADEARERKKSLFFIDTLAESDCLLSC